jgi:hypothetical protein
MLTPIWDEQPPERTTTAIRALWKDLCIEGSLNAEPAAAILLEALRKTHSNGGAKFATFTIAYNRTFQWFISRNLWNEIEFPEHFLKSPAVTALLPELCKDTRSDSFEFEQISAFSFAGDLAQTLSQGGAYNKHQPGPGDASAIAERFQQTLFGDRFDEMLALKSFKPWSAWFFDIAWDSTWLILDKRHSKVCLLAVTDTD